MNSDKKNSYKREKETKKFFAERGACMIVKNRSRRWMYIYIYASIAKKTFAAHPKETQTLNFFFVYDLLCFTRMPVVVAQGIYSVLFFLVYIFRQLTTLIPHSTEIDRHSIPCLCHDCTVIRHLFDAIKKEKSH